MEDIQKNSLGSRGDPKDGTKTTDMKAEFQGPVLEALGCLSKGRGL